ncbi:hypothetical protein [Spiroplasma taiwanense]|uniref:Uncharacterized protein n=1 Tax=Spiroplasma taiwanense CT-1 TaxID=1276220 RepID=S5MG28_9MOLU|nr:hypothetical protein [Spiroplasma taiwanense]AGR40825.1 hypothetical protein STAIW_v1c01390 [Spiroplasma taiwanense CT-1]
MFQKKKHEKSIIFFKPFFPSFEIKDKLLLLNSNELKTKYIKKINLINSNELTAIIDGEKFLYLSEESGVVNSLLEETKIVWSNIKLNFQVLDNKIIAKDKITEIIINHVNEKKIA